VALQGRESEDFAAPPPTVPTAVAKQLDTPDHMPGDEATH
jgi:hypothetical protein